ATMHLQTGIPVSRFAALARLGAKAPSMTSEVTIVGRDAKFFVEKLAPHFPQLGSHRASDAAEALKICATSDILLIPTDQLRAHPPRQPTAAHVAPPPATTSLRQDRGAPPRRPHCGGVGAALQDFRHARRRHKRAHGGAWLRRDPSAGEAARDRRRGGFSDRA